MKNILKFSLFLIPLFTFITSCDEVGEIEDDGTSVQDMSGEWYVEFLVDGQDVYGLGYTLFATYNTAANTGDEMWIDDQEHTWSYKCKVDVNTSTQTFSGENIPLEFYYYADNPGESATITNGKILKDAATTSGGNVSDSITFNIEFSDDPGTIYQVAGYKRTGFAEDEH